MNDDPLNPPCMVRYRTVEQVGTAILVKRGPKYSQVIQMDSSGIRLRRVPRDEERYMTILTYPLERAKKLFRDAVKRYNKGHVSNGLKEALRATPNDN